MVRYVLIFLALSALIYGGWFRSEGLTGGDLHFEYEQTLKGQFSPFSSWYFNEDSGLGGSVVRSLWIYIFSGSVKKIFGGYWGLDWQQLVLIGYFAPFLILVYFSSASLYSRLTNNHFFFLIGSLIYSFNTYILTLMGGGQVGVGLAYGMAPLVLKSFMEISNSFKNHSLLIRRSLIAGIILGLQVMFDLRIAYVTLMACGLYALASYLVYRFSLVKFFVFCSLFFGLALALHAFWLLPAALAGTAGIEKIGKAYTSIEAVKFFSFADFAHSFSLLHPNWPENIFGKIYFMESGFLLLPILAYSSLLFMRNSKHQAPNHKQIPNFKFQISDNNLTILYFTLLGTIGAFLAKGAGAPFGEVYLWLFEHIPGFIMFRDPTKFYVLIALSYSILIPFSLVQIGRWLTSKFKIQNSKAPLKIQFLLVLGFLGYWLFLIRPAWTGELGGTFKARQTPEEYIELKNFIYSQPEFFRTFWIPRRQRFGFFSNNHPGIDSLDLLETTDSETVVEWLKSDKAQNQLERWGVKYIIVPFDSEKELFLKDREYSPALRAWIINELEQITWLTKFHYDYIYNDSKIGIFELKDYKDHFWINQTANNKEQKAVLEWEFINPTRYLVRIKDAQGPFKLVFSESFDRGWAANVKCQSSNVKCQRAYRVNSKTTDDSLNSFPVDADGILEVEVFYEPQKYVDYGLIISGLTLVIVVIFLAGSFLKKRE